MSRAIPSNFNEYVLDQNTRNLGIICDGGIMPLRNNPDSSSTWYKKCLRGEDIMFLKEAVAARYWRGSNNGMSSKKLDKNNLINIRADIAPLFTSGYWTDIDPRQAIGQHDFGSSYPQTSDINTYVMSCFHTISQTSIYDTYDVLDHVPVENLFNDVKQLNYYYMTSPTSYRYDGFTQNVLFEYRQYSQQNHTDGGDPTINDQTDTTYLWVWNSLDMENYWHGQGYPNNLRQMSFIQPLSCTITYTENSSSIYRNFHRFLEVVPFGVCKVENSYNAWWNWQNGNEDSESWTTSKYILTPLPSSLYVDMQNNTVVQYNDQTAWTNWISSVCSFAGMEMYATNIVGRYQVTDKQHQRTRQCIVDAPLQVFWIGHFMYCSLQ